MGENIVQNKEGVVAYFSLEIGLDARLPLYSGGLGILAGDTIKSSADLAVPMVGVSLLYEDGYFHQLIEDGQQKEIPVKWNKTDFLKPHPEKIIVNIEGRDIYVQAWEYTLCGAREAIPIYFLSTNLPENSEWDRNITQKLYGGDRWYRLCQEIILGIGGVKMLRALGYGEDEGMRPVRKYHMNEGHSAMLTIELHKEMQQRYPEDSDPLHADLVKQLCVFTTHTPVPAGHDSFPMDFMKNAIGDYYPVYDLDFNKTGRVNFTHVALNFSGHINGVAKKHRDVSKKMFPGYQIDAITNGVHSATWTCQQFQDLYDEFISGWRRDNFMLRYSLNIPGDKIWDAHQARKKELIDYVNRSTDAGFNYDTLTIGFARRAATYKRGDLIFRNIERLRKICENNPVQIVFAGKAHPNDGGGKELIKKINDIAKGSSGNLKIVYLSNYEMWLGKLMTSGVDVWMNTPKRPLEASGTSGMKAAHNGVPHFSVLDGWWLEGHVEGVTGWSIGPMPKGYSDDEEDSEDLYNKLEQKIIPTYYYDRKKWIAMMLHTISHNASFFNTQRMVSQYVTGTYFD